MTPRARGRTAALVAAWLAACAGAAPRLRPASPDAGISERVIAVLEHHHLSGRTLDAELAARAEDELERAIADDRSCAPVSRPRPSDYAAALRHGDFSYADALCRACRTPLPCEAGERDLALHTLARAFDPHSSYLDTAEVSDRRAQLADPELDDVGDARARLMQQDGIAIGWVVLPTFYLRDGGRNASEDVTHLTRELVSRGAHAIVLDLRGNTGGVVSEALRLLGALGCSGPVARARERDGVLETLEAPAHGDPYQGELVVLVDARSASASELFAAVLQDRGRAPIVGEQTFGKGTQQSLKFLSSPLGAFMGAVNVTTREWFRRDGRSLQRHGVAPDVALDAPEPEPLRESSLRGALLPGVLPPLPDQRPTAAAPAPTEPSPARRAAIALARSLPPAGAPREAKPAAR